MTAVEGELLQAPGLKNGRDQERYLRPILPSRGERDERNDNGRRTPGASRARKTLQGGEAVHHRSLSLPQPTSAASNDRWFNRGRVPCFCGPSWPCSSFQDLSGPRKHATQPSAATTRSATGSR